MPQRSQGRASLSSHQLLDLTLQKQCDNFHVNPDDALHREIKGNCGQCHNQEDWLPATFTHEDYFRLDRDHNTECETCHINNDYADYTCYGCHEHSRSKIREEHVEEGIYDYEICVECHVVVMKMKQNVFGRQNALNQEN